MPDIRLRDLNIPFPPKEQRLEVVGDNIYLGTKVVATLIPNLTASERFNATTLIECYYDRDDVYEILATQLS